MRSVLSSRRANLYSEFGPQAMLLAYEAKPLRRDFRIGPSSTQRSSAGTTPIIMETMRSQASKWYPTAITPWLPRKISESNSTKARDPCTKFHLYDPEQGSFGTEKSPTKRQNRLHGLLFAPIQGVRSTPRWATKAILKTTFFQRSCSTQHIGLSIALDASYPPTSNTNSTWSSEGKESNGNG